MVINEQTVKSQNADFQAHGRNLRKTSEVQKMSKRWTLSAIGSIWNSELEHFYFRLSLWHIATLLMFTAWLQLDYGKILCNFCLLEFTRGPNGKCFNEEFALAFIGKCYKWLLLFSSTNSVDSQKYLDGSTNRFEDEKS